MEDSNFRDAGIPDGSYEFDLKHYLECLWKNKFFITLVVIISVLSTGVFSLFRPNIYQAKAVISPVKTKEPSGGFSTLAMEFGGLQGSQLLGSSMSSEVVSILNSSVLREMVIQRHDLLPVLFYERWDNEKKVWKKDEKGIYNPLILIRKIVRADSAGSGDPTIWDGLRLFDKIMNVRNNVKENTITVSIDFYDPEVATKIVAYFLETLNDHMSGEVKRVADVNRKYLEGQLSNTTDPFIKQKIYNLIAQQIETAMMAEVKENFAFKLIDPPRVPDKKIRPKRALWVATSFVLSLFFGIFGAALKGNIKKDSRV